MHRTKAAITDSKWLNFISVWSNVVYKQSYTKGVAPEPHCSKETTWCFLLLTWTCTVYLQNTPVSVCTLLCNFWSYSSLCNKTLFYNSFNNIWGRGEEDRSKSFFFFFESLFLHSFTLCVFKHWHSKLFLGLAVLIEACLQSDQTHIHTCCKTN